jgi:RNA polymerase sigma factor (sigma-70 family)
MPPRTLTTALRHLAPDDTPDGELLARYVHEQDEAAFAALVLRHGGMVRSVCRRVLRNDADADDAVQATFLVLVRKAAAVRDRNGLANWLFGVAHNVALKARQTRTRRQRRESDAPPRPPEAVASDFAELLHAELAKLPAATRGVIVLCDLEGRTIADAAKEIGVPAGTVASRLARGREQLAIRLRRYGLSMSGGLVATLFGEPASAAVVFDPTTVPPVIHSLANEVTRTMFTTPKMTKLLVMLAAGGLTLAVAWGQAPPKAPPPSAPKAPPVAKPDDPPKKFAPFFTLSQAIVSWDGEDKLKVWAQMPVGRFLKLTDAKGRAVHVQDFTHRQLGPVWAAADELELYDAAGSQKPKADWKKLIRGETVMLCAMKGFHDPKNFRGQFGTFLKDDVLILVVSEKVHAQLGPLENLPEIESLPQVFPGQPAKPGDPVPPPKK